MRTVVAGGALRGIVGRPRQQDRRVASALGNDDDGVKLHAVAHRDHHFAADVIVESAGAVKLFGISLSVAAEEEEVKLASLAVCAAAVIVNPATSAVREKSLNDMLHFCTVACTALER